MKCLLTSHLLTNRLLTGALLAMVLGITGCAGTPTNLRINCDKEVDSAWQELSFAKAKGFSGSVSYTKAFSLVTAAKTQQTVENFSGCYNNAQKARFYIQESLAGR